MSAAKEWHGVHEPGGLEWDNIEVRLKQRLADGRPCFDARQSHCLPQIFKLDPDAVIVWLIRYPTDFVQSAVNFHAVLQNHPDPYFWKDSYTDKEALYLAAELWININCRIYLATLNHQVVLRRTEGLKYFENVNEKRRAIHVPGDMFASLMNTYDGLLSEFNE